MKSSSVSSLEQAAPAGYPSFSEFVSQRDPPGFFHHSFLAQFDLRPPAHPISAIIVTYNRCPSSDFSRNPLVWAVESLQRQHNSGLQEIIVVDDHSSDFTPKTVAHLAKNSRRPIRYHHNEKIIGSPRSRNVALEMAGEELVFFMDDDCLVTPYALFGLSHTYSFLPRRHSLGAIHLPVFYRSSQPRAALPASNLSRLDPDKALMTSSFDCFPAEALEEIVQNRYSFPDDELKIFSPLPVQNLAGVFLAQKEALQKAGRFPTHFTWRNSYTEESELALRLQEQGYELFFLYDPKFQAVHLRYGFQDGTSFSGPDWKEEGTSLAVLTGLSNQSFGCSGNRVEDEEWSYSKILSKYVLFGLRSELGAARWVQQSYQDFVNLNCGSFYSYSGQSLPRRKARKRVWQKALAEGKRLVREIKILPQERRFYKE